MKKSILVLIAIMFVSLTHAQWYGKGKKIKGNGNVTTITRTTSDYDGIKCAGSFDYILVAGEEGKITIEGEENLLEYIVTEIKDNQLVVKTQKKINLQTSKNNTIKITIPFKDINHVSLAGSGDLYNKDTISASDLSVALAGSGDLILDVATSNVKGSIAGSGDLTLKGKTENLEAKVAGSGDFHGFNLESNNTTVSVAGSGDAEVVSRKSLKARVAGSGDIEYKGNPEKEDTKVSGSGSISN
ncbi:head GIN domain-containing protein [Ichthyenterobacterium sp. W332]|uniref:Head GIN domain-containing protein n=1 Tax=Microcosmobacter mediterraneus TaxID=3075607 RepID=A0ABU2YHJ6_9FLAO|nr:head GIN domain-containing protein [Ichthyenterobacterium sp. W332]MDT0557649.1 head GIN domain-containing protein [Ichthyenterobacterium sp. W332]